jgi:hypothetical protein
MDEVRGDSGSWSSVAGAINAANNPAALDTPPAQAPETKSPADGAEAAAYARKRRSKRIHIATPVIVSAKSGSLSLQEPTTTLQVNAHGCLVILTAPLQAGQQVTLANPATNERTECTVSFVGKKDGMATEIGLEFSQPSPFFWRIHFPPEDWNPEDRKLPSAVPPPSLSLRRK